MSKQAYFIGIKGVGMTSLALAMQDAGWTVQGSDTDEVFITDAILSSRQIPVFQLGSALPPNIDLLVHSAAYTPPQTKITTLSLAAALAEFVKDRQVIAVAGVGGKTTTSAMLAAMFYQAGRPVGYYVGTNSIAGLKAPGASGTDPYFIVEADEYAVSKTDPRPKFALLNPQIIITTNIVHDHPDIYPTAASTLSAFQSLLDRLSKGGTWICNPADPLTSRLLSGDSQKPIKIVPYGPNHPLYHQLKLAVFGEQNKLDALAAVLGGIAAGLSKKAALLGIEAYHGAGRRQEFHGEVKGRLLYDDYGHHPQEIALTVQSFKAKFPGRRLILVFESHTYSRTESLLPDFAKAIAQADIPVIMPIFESAREKGVPHTITPASFAAAVKKYQPLALPVTWESAAATVWDLSRPGDLILTMGAGFVYKLHDQFKLK